MSTFFKKNRILVSGALIVAALLLLVFFLPKANVDAPADITNLEKLNTEDYQKNAGEQKKEYVFVAQKNGQTAMDLIARSVKLDVKKFDFGIMIDAVNDVKSDKTKFWAFYVNDEFATKAIDKTILKKGDMVKLRLEEIESIKGI